jgi:hypothetical protein
VRSFASPEAPRSNIRLEEYKFRPVLSADSPGGGRVTGRPGSGKASWGWEAIPGEREESDADNGAGERTVWCDSSAS